MSDLALVLKYNLQSYRNKPVPFTRDRSVAPNYIEALNRMFTLWETFIMPAKHALNGERRNDWEVTFVNFRLSTEEKAHFTKWLKESAENHHVMLAQCIMGGNKISISHDRKNETFIASMTCSDETSPNYRFCMTSRSDDWYTALMLNCYKHLELAANTTWSDLQQDADWG